MYVIYMYNYMYNALAAPARRAPPRARFGYIYYTYNYTYI